ncbi:hypothetical protein MKZ38_000109 [Zalerion maritima]|uniref:Uncharacterized protein n=1 Tax=Zalerion maritima TaxID=339359 RepID=A0AAD5WSQ1_9PEZI|nr:hypothetical protein MKZ38_000109 [Zalerion maritima]
MAPLPVSDYPLFGRSSSPSAWFNPTSANKARTGGIHKKRSVSSKFNTTARTATPPPAEEELREQIKKLRGERDVIQSEIDLQWALLATIDADKEPGGAERCQRSQREWEKKRNVLSREIDLLRKRLPSQVNTNSRKPSATFRNKIQSERSASPASSSPGTMQWPGNPQGGQGFAFGNATNNGQSAGSSRDGNSSPSMPPFSNLANSSQASSNGQNPSLFNSIGNLPTFSLLGNTNGHGTSPSSTSQRVSSFSNMGSPASNNQVAGVKRSFDSGTGFPDAVIASHQKRQSQRPRFSSNEVIDLTGDDGAENNGGGNGFSTNGLAQGFGNQQGISPQSTVHNYHGLPAIQQPNFNNDHGQTFSLSHSRPFHSQNPTLGQSSNGWNNGLMPSTPSTTLASNYHTSNIHSSSSLPNLAGHGMADNSMNGSYNSGYNQLGGPSSAQNPAVQYRFTPASNISGSYVEEDGIHYEFAGCTGDFNPLARSAASSNNLQNLTHRTYGLSVPGAGFGGQYAHLAYRFGHNAESVDVKKEISSLLTNITPRSEDGSLEARHQTPAAMKNNLYEHQKIALKWMKDRESEGKSRGGILADDMGLGKTISALSLIADHKSSNPRRKTTLIVGPVAIVRQWEQEIKDKLRATHSLSVFLHHNKKESFEALRNYDVVLTTYGVLSAEYKRIEGYTVKHKMSWADTEGISELRKNCPLLHPKSKWYRVILDESQCAKNRNAQCSKAVRQLDSIYRWCLTGTPMMNNIEELYSIFAFLQTKPYDSWDDFQNHFKCLSPKNHNNYEPVRKRALQKLQTVLAAIMMRRTKQSVIDGKPIITLPKKTEEETYVVFDEEEERYYRGLEQRNVDIFNKYNRQGTVGKNYAVMLVLLLRLRQACCHPHLNTDVEPAPSQAELNSQLVHVHNITQQAIETIKHGIETSAFACGSCDDAATSPIFFSPCGHAICEACMLRIRADVEATNVQMGLESEANDNTACPQCANPVKLKNTFRLVAFKKCHMPELLEDEANQSAESDSETEDEEDDDLDSPSNVKNEPDADDKGNLKGFVVADSDPVDEVGDSQESASELEGPSTLTNPTSPDSGSTIDHEIFKLEEFNKAEDDVFNTEVEPKKANPTEAGTEIADSDSDLDYGVEDAEAELQGFIKGKSSPQVAIKPAKFLPQPKPAVPKKRKNGRKSKKDGTEDVRATELGILRKEAQKNRHAREKYMRYLVKNWQPSAKVTKAAELLKNICQVKKEKVIIFSSFTGLLDLLEIPLLHDLKLKYERFDGGMSGQQRDKALTTFKEDRNVKVLLVSLKAGNAGLNLTVANNVIIMDPYWNPFIENQAVDRTYRIGQMKAVMVHRILVKSTIEDRILELQKQKKGLVEAALDQGTAASLTRLSVGELGYLLGANDR